MWGHKPHKGLGHHGCSSSDCLGGSCTEFILSHMETLSALDETAV